jgi:hypothetical protein
MGFEVIGSVRQPQPDLTDLDKGPVTLKFAAAEWTWLHDVIGDAHKLDQLSLSEAILIREAVHQLSKRGGWSGELREAVLERRAVEPHRGRRKGV